MATIIKAFILCETDNSDEATEAVFAALNSGAFDSRSPVADFALGVEKTVTVETAAYHDGDLMKLLNDTRDLTATDVLPLAA